MGDSTRRADAGAARLEGRVGIAVILGPDAFRTGAFPPNPPSAAEDACSSDRRRSAGAADEPVAVEQNHRSAVEAQPATCGEIGK